MQNKKMYALLAMLTLLGFLASGLWPGAAAGSRQAAYREGDPPYEFYLPLIMGNYTTPLLEEGFESGLMPPPGWQRLKSNPAEPGWLTYDSPDRGAPGPYVGQYSAACYEPWEGSQIAVLLSPPFEFSAARLDFYSFGSPEVCRDDPFGDECDLNVWLVIGDWDWGVGDDDLFFYTADADWTGEYEWSHSTVDLPTVPAGTSVRLAFEYYGSDWGDFVALDAIRVTEH